MEHANARLFQLVRRVGAYQELVCFLQLLVKFDIICITSSIDIFTNNDILDKLQNCFAVVLSHLRIPYSLFLRKGAEKENTFNFTM